MSNYKWKPFTLLVSAEEVEIKLKLEAGKYYKTRDGRKVGPMRELDRNKTDWPWTDKLEDMPDQRYTDDGKEIGTGSDFDLIAEWQDETPSPIREVTRRELVAGKYGAVHLVNIPNGDWTIGIDDCNWNSEELREAAHILVQVAEYLESEGN